MNRLESFERVRNFVKSSLEGDMEVTSETLIYKGIKFTLELNSIGYQYSSYISVDKFTLRIKIENVPYTVTNYKSRKSYFDKRITTRTPKLDVKDVLKKMDALIEMKEYTIALVKKEAQERVVSKSISTVRSAALEVELEGRRLSFTKFLGSFSVGVITIEVTTFKDLDAAYQLKGMRKHYSLKNVMKVLDFFIELDKSMEV